MALYCIYGAFRIFQGGRKLGDVLVELIHLYCSYRHGIDSRRRIASLLPNNETAKLQAGTHENHFKSFMIHEYAKAKVKSLGRDGKHRKTAALGLLVLHQCELLFFCTFLRVSSDRLSPKKVLTLAAGFCRFKPPPPPPLPLSLLHPCPDGPGC